MFWYKFSIFFHLLGFSVTLLIPLYWRQSLGFSEASIGTLNSIGTAISMAAPVFYGWLGSRVQPERPIFWSFVVFAAAAPLFLVCTAQPVHCALFALLQFVKWGPMTLVPVGVLHLVSRAAGSEYGRYRRIGSLGFLTGLIGFGWLTDSLGIETIFWVMATCMLLAAAPFRRTIQVPLCSEGGASYLALLRERRLRCFFLGVALLTSFFSLCFVYLPLRMSELGSSNAFTSFVMALCGVTALATLAAVGRFCDRIGRTPQLLLLVPVCGSLRVLLMYFPESGYWWFAVIQLLHIPTWVLFDVLTIKFLKEHAAADGFARCQALVLVSTSFGMALGAGAAAWFTQHFGLRQAFLYSAPLPLLALPFFWALIESGALRGGAAERSLTADSDRRCLR